MILIVHFVYKNESFTIVLGATTIIFVATTYFPQLDFIAQVRTVYFGIVGVATGAYLLIVFLGEGDPVRGFLIAALFSAASLFIFAIGAVLVMLAVTALITGDKRLIKVVEGYDGIDL